MTFKENSRIPDTPKRKDDPYDDIMHLPHHESRTRSPMSASDRAAQYSPFDALTGYGSAITETARLTEQNTELDEEEKERLDQKLRLLYAALSERPSAVFTMFLPDPKKDGGSRVTISGCAVSIDLNDRIIRLADGTDLDIDRLLAVEGPLFADLD